MVKWFLLWLVLSAAYAAPVMYWADTSRPTDKEIKRTWIYDSLSLIAEHKGTKGNIVEVQRLFPQVQEDQQLRLIDEFWKAESEAYRTTYRIEPGFLAPVRALNERYQARLATGTIEREQAHFAALIAWGLPVAGGLLLVGFAWLRRHNAARRALDDPSD